MTAELEAQPGGLLMEASGVVKTYGAVRALRGASLSIRRGEVHALLGANGAGKSTLVKILTGAVKPDAGEIVVRGQSRTVHSPAEARQAGLVPVYQEPALIPDLDVASNLRLTGTPAKAFMGWVSQLGVQELDQYAMVRDLPLAVLRVLDLARALAFEPDILLLDEMTAALPADLAERVLEVIGSQRETGRSVIFISHRLLEVGALCDRATVLRDGETVGVVEMAAGAEERIVELMLGESTDDEADVHRRVVSVSSTVMPAGGAAQAGGAVATERRPRLDLRDLSSGTRLKSVTFDLFPGEVLGLVALEGQGQDELFGILSGAARPSGGTLHVDGKESHFRHPADAIAAGLVYVPGDRAEALLMQRSVRENIALPTSARWRRWGPIGMAAEKLKVDAAIQKLQIDTRAQGEVRRLSGGNQQKVTIARWIAEGVQTLLCFDPTRGIDIRTKRQIYHLLRELAESGAAVLLYTSELEEVQLACDRAVVIFNGRVVAEMPAEDADEPALMRAAYGLPAMDSKAEAVLGLAGRGQSA
ncbi:MAG: sugar ABC transporter ATP-binding protein [Candidatus Limnocylindrales bacterium]